MATKPKHGLPPSVVVNYTSHNIPTNPKAKDSLHILQGDGHLAARKVERVGLRPPPVRFNDNNRTTVRYLNFVIKRSTKSEDTVTCPQLQ
jgi:hypothetical protein